MRQPFTRPLDSAELVLNLPEPDLQSAFLIAADAVRFALDWRAREADWADLGFTEHRLREVLGLARQVVAVLDPDTEYAAHHRRATRATSGAIRGGQTHPR